MSSARTRIERDEYHLIVAPVVVGAGKTFFAADVRVDLALVDQRGFETASSTSAIGSGPERGRRAPISSVTPPRPAVSDR